MNRWSVVAVVIILVLSSQFVHAYGITPHVDFTPNFINFFARPGDTVYLAIPIANVSTEPTCTVRIGQSDITDDSWSNPQFPSLTKSNNPIPWLSVGQSVLQSNYSLVIPNNAPQNTYYQYGVEIHGRVCKDNGLYIWASDAPGNFDWRLSSEYSNSYATLLGTCNFGITVVPEPSSIAALLYGTCSIGVFAIRKRR